MATGDTATPLVSIAIKCLNEEQKIAASIESALVAGKATGLPFEVVVADSGSTDATVAIACQYPVRVVQLADKAAQGCGAGTQLAYAHTRGRFVYLMDGDMQLDPALLTVALARMESDPLLGGTAGLLSDGQVRNGFDRIRRNNRPTATPGLVTHLGGGGLYRRAAIDSAGGYAADRNLKAYEEAELGFRLRAAGWRLERIAAPGVMHIGHEQGTIALLLRHWRSGRAFAGAQLLRSAIGRTWLYSAMRLLVHPIAVLGWWLLLFPAASILTSRNAALGMAIGAPTVLFLALSLRKRDVQHAATSLLHWHYGAAALAIGLFARRCDPTLPLNASLIRDPAD